MEQPSDEVQHKAPRGAGAVDLKPTAGVRALSCIGVLMGHVIYYVAQGAQNKAAMYGDFKHNLWLNGALHLAEPSMDCFMVLTGFLAALSLIPALEKAPQLGKAVARYYMKRAARILPAYYVTLAIIHGILLPTVNRRNMSAEIWEGFFGHRSSFDLDVCREHGWRNFLFLNNQLPMGGCFNISWSLAVQVHFYVLFPLGLLLLRPKTSGFRWRIALAAGLCIAAQTVERLIIAQVSGFWKHVPPAAFGPMTPELVKAFDILALWSYLPISARMGALALGVLAAMAVSDERWQQNIARWRAQIMTALIASSIPAFGGCFQYKVGAAHEPDHPLSDRVLFSFAFTFVVGVFCPLVPTCLLALVCSGQPGLSRLLAWLLSSRALSALADVSYEVYLLHPLVIRALFSAVPPSLWFSPERPLVFGLMTCLVLGLSVVAATLLKDLLSMIMGAGGSGTAKVPESPKLTTAGPSREVIEMHTRAVEVHSPMSPASAPSA